MDDVNTWPEYGKKLYDTVEENRAQSPPLAADDGVTRFTEKIVKEAIGQLKRGKSGDCGGLTTKIFKALKSTSLVKVLTRLFNKILKEGDLPLEWGQSTAVLLFKAGDPTCQRNHDQRNPAKTNGKVL